MNQTNRMKALDRGLKVYRMAPLSRIITQATSRGGWTRVVKSATLTDLKKQWKVLMSQPDAIDD